MLKPLFLIFFFLLFGFGFCSAQYSQETLDKSYQELVDMAKKQNFSLVLVEHSHPKEGNGREILEVAIQFLEENPLPEALMDFLQKDLYEKSFPIASEIQERMNQYQTVRTSVSEALQKPYICFELDYSKGFEMEYHHSIGFLDCSKVLVLQAILDVEQKKYKESLEGLLLCLSLSEVILDDQILISSMVSIAIREQVMAFFATYGPLFPYSEEEENLLYQKLANYKVDREFYNPITAEYNGISGLFDAFRKQEINKKELMEKVSFGAEGSGMMDRLEQMAFMLSWNPYQDIGCYYDQMKHLISTKGKGYQDVSKMMEDVQKELEAQGKKTPIFAILWPTYNQVWEKFVAHQAEVSCFLTYMKVRAYFHQKQVYPQTMDELKSVASNLPQDPYNESDLKYKLEEGTLWIYSVGPNLKDDQGQLSEEDSEDYDIGFQITVS